MSHDVTSELVLVIGGAASGKSRLAERIALQQCPRPHYVATARAGDAEMAAKIGRHAARRGGDWTLVEEPGDVAGRLPALGARAILLDCATIWLANRMEAGRDPAAETARLLRGIGDAGCPVVVVTNELGGGMVPMDAGARAFRDAHGAMNQALAAAAGRAVLAVAGLAVELK